MTIEIREFVAGDYDEAGDLWRVSEGIVLRDVDAREPVERYLIHNPGLSFVARDLGVLVGAVLCGTDGRRGYLHHLAVAPSHRLGGLGRTLARRCISALAERGIDKCHLFVLTENAVARAFWRGAGWSERRDVLLLSHTRSDSPTS